MTDFNLITPRLATGAAISSAADAATLVAAGITAVVDCRAETDDAPFLVGSGLAYLWNPTQDDGQHKSPDWFAKTLSFALPLIAQPHQVVNLHCAAGVNRGPSAAYAVMRALGWSPGDAEAAIRKVRPQVGLAYKADADAAILALGYDTVPPAAVVSGGASMAGGSA
ncbi:MAG: hypothetical protein NVS3B1_06390 [Marmoricola sp.]